MFSQQSEKDKANFTIQSEGTNFKAELYDSFPLLRQISEIMNL
jgi:hypothetical protein